MIYLDNASTTKPLDEATQSVIQQMTSNYGNPSSLHGLGIKAEKILDDCRQSIARVLKCDESEIFLTSGATESNNTAIFGIAKNYGRRKKRIVTTAIEHPSVSEPMKQLELSGYEVLYVEPNENGEISADDFLEKINDDTFLVSAMMVNNETGYVLPIAEIFSRVKRNNKDIITHCDAVQGFLKLPFSANKLCADVISLSGHKVHSPKGIGAMYIKKGIRVAPLLYGGGQEKKQRSGTESVPLVAGFNAAVSALTPSIGERYAHANELRNYLFDILSKCDYVKFVSSEKCSPYIISFSIIGIKSEIMLHFLEQKDIFVSSGSACSKGAKSSVLKAFAVEKSQLDTTIRVSLSFNSQKSELDALAEAIDEGYLCLQKIR